MDENREERLARKKELYHLLDNSANSDDDADDGRSASEAFLRHVSGVATAAISSRRRSASAQSKNTSSPNQTQIHSDGHQVKAPSVRTQQVTASKPGDATFASDTKRAGKRKRKADVGQENQIHGLFAGMRFYFFPNNDVHPGRRMRIAKAVEHGAVWLKLWDETVTHAVLDKDIDFSLLKGYLNLQVVPENIQIVPEHYPAECISYGSVLDPALPRFSIKGLVRTSKPNLAMPSRADSLPLKSVKSGLLARPQQTPVSVDTNSMSEGPDLEPVADVRQVVQRFESSSSASLEAADVVADSLRAAETTRELEDAIAKAKALQHLPVDSDDEDEKILRFPEQRTSFDETVWSLAANATHNKKKTIPYQDKFQCMQKHAADKHDSPNVATIEILQQMADYYGQMGDEWRIRAYRKAIATLRTHPIKVTSKDEALALPNIGERLATKIEEIVYTNRLRRLDAARAEPTDQILRIFMGVYGAGYAIASRWVRQGHNTLDSLLSREDLTSNQRIGIEHYSDFASRIPREEVAAHGAVVRKALTQLDSNAELIIGGSYRRGSSTSGDIDCIITHPTKSSAELRDLVLDKLVTRLSRQGFLVAALATSSSGTSASGHDASKWHGASCLPGSQIWRRLDLLLVPAAELGAALIYFTGNDIFNRSLRLLASTKGMRLNQRGLYRDVIRGKQREKVTEGTLIEGRDEIKIFEILGVPWRPPEHRIC